MSPCKVAAPQRHHAGSALVVVLAALAAGPAAAIQPRAEGHFLTNTELSNISTISCLEARQKNPGIRCRNESLLSSLGGTTFSGRLNAGNYPNYKEAVCNSNGEFFCDPSSIFSMDERKNLTAELKRLRYNNPVTCGYRLNDPVDPRHYQPFYLGVALATNWPSSESDPDSLQQLGQIIDTDWNMDHLFVGQPVPYLRCPNSAVLIFMPEIRRAFVSASSCEFICQERGGPEVATAALVALDRAGPAAAVRAAMSEAYRVVSRDSENSWKAMASDNVVRSGAIRKAEAGGSGRETQSRAPPRSPDGNSVILLTRVLYGIALAALVISLAIGIVFLVAAPDWLGISPPRRRRK